jgi:hypothetical protein
MHETVFFIVTAVKPHNSIKFRNKPAISSPERSGFLFGLLLDSKNGDNMFFRNVQLSPKYTELQQTTLSLLIPRE